MVVVGEEETEEADEEAATKEAETREAKVSAIPTTLLPEPANCTKNSENLHGRVQTDIHVLGETTRAPDQKIIETLLPAQTSR